MNLRWLEGTLPELLELATSLRQSVESFIALLDVRKSLSMLGGGVDVQRALIMVAGRIHFQAEGLTREAIELHEGWYHGRLLTEQEREYEYDFGKSPVVIAVDTIRADMVISEAMVKVVPFPVDFLLETMIHDPSEAVGHLARVDILPGMIFTKGLLT